MVVLSTLENLVKELSFFRYELRRNSLLSAVHQLLTFKVFLDPFFGATMQ